MEGEVGREGVEKKETSGGGDRRETGHTGEYER